MTASEGAVAARRPVRPSSLRVAEIVTPAAPSTVDEALAMERDDKRRRSQTEYI